MTGRALLREIRQSFYRKLFLLFVAASVVPVLALAFVTRAYVAGQLREGLEEGALRTASAARRVIETVVSQQRRDRNDPNVLNDDVMISVSRIIDQDVNVFVNTGLVATSQRDLFASGLLPTRTPAEAARAITIERQASYVGDERLGLLQYTVAAVPVRDGEAGAILTVPLTLRQQEIEREIDVLDRRVTLATVLFILLGAAIGYVTAERIADPVNRLTRATRRIARGDLDARIHASTADELRRLVDAFNQMADDLKHQRSELERTNRLAAWADMARQVAHDIKNPLTPIQLSAEHLRRVHRDAGSPLGGVLDGCVDTILSQVALLRQISSEFSSFASSPDCAPGADATVGRDRRSRGAVPRGPARQRAPRHRGDRPAARAVARSGPARPRAGQRDRERAARDARRRHADAQDLRARRRRGDRDRRHGRRHGRRGAGAPLRAVLLHEGHRHGPRPHDREAERRAERRHDRRARARRDAGRR